MGARSVAQKNRFFFTANAILGQSSNDVKLDHENDFVVFSFRLTSKDISWVLWKFLWFPVIAEFTPIHIAPCIHSLTGSLSVVSDDIHIRPVLVMIIKRDIRLDNWQHPRMDHANHDIIELFSVSHRLASCHRSLSCDVVCCYQTAPLPRTIVESQYTFTSGSAKRSKKYFFFFVFTHMM